MATRSGGSVRPGEATSPLSPEFASLLQKVQSYDTVQQDRDRLAAALAASQQQVRELEARSVQYPFLLDQHAAAVAESRQLKAQLLIAEDEQRRNKPVKDAMLRELQTLRDALAASRNECAALAAKNAEAEAQLQQDGTVLTQLRSELETTTRQLVHLTAEAAHARDATAALAAAQAECTRLRGERAQLLEAEQRRSGAFAVGQEETEKQLALLGAELQAMRSKAAKNDVEHRQLCWALAAAENTAKGLTAQLAASETAREETERMLRAARSDAALAAEAQERANKATAAVTHLVLSRGASGTGPKSGEDAVAAAANGGGVPVAPVAGVSNLMVDHLRSSLEKALQEKAALQQQLAASERELHEFAEQVLQDAQTMHAEREALTAERDVARAHLQRLREQQRAAASTAAASVPPSSPTKASPSTAAAVLTAAAGAALASAEAGGWANGEGADISKTGTQQERVAAIEQALAAHTLATRAT